MFLEDTWRLPAVFDECFTSWLFRITLDERRNFDKTAIYHLFRSGHDVPVFDPDYCMRGIKFDDCCRYISVAPERIRKRFLAPCAWVIPRQFRTSYCIECMQESISICGLPTYKRAWGCMLLPFCLRHKTLLREGSFAKVDDIDAAVALFKNHWRQSRLNQYLPENDLPWLPLALRTQKALIQGQQLHGYLAYKVLIQLFLWPELCFTAGERNRNIWSKSVASTSYIRLSDLSALHRHALQACTITRAKALCYLGRIMKVVSDKELQKAFSTDLFSPKCLDEIVKHCSVSASSPVVINVFGVLRCAIDLRIEDDLVRLIRSVCDAAKI
jgi:hypothetical protein